MMAELKDGPIVFILDDDVDVREALKALLESVNIRCSVFRTTREFVQHKHEDEPSCLILDVRLTGGSGLELQRELDLPRRRPCFRNPAGLGIARTGIQKRRRVGDEEIRTVRQIEDFRPELEPRGFR